jgi:mannosyltransferase
MSSVELRRRAPAATFEHTANGTGRLVAFAAVAGPAAIAIALSAYKVTDRSIWGDEAATVTIASQHGAAFGAALARDGGNMLGYYSLIHVLIAWFGDSELVIRLPSVLAAGITVGLVSIIGTRLFDRRTGVAASLLCAVSLPLVFWAQDARGYAPMTAAVTAAFLAFIAIVDPRPGARHSNAVVVAYGISTLVSIYCSYVAVLAVGAQLVALLVYRGHLRRVLAGLVPTALCCVPLAVLAIQRGSGQLAWVARPTPTSTYQLFELVTSAGFEPNIGMTSTGRVLLPLTIALVCLLAIRVVVRCQRDGLEQQRGEILVLAWVVVPLALAFIESEVAQSIFTSRNLITVLPAVALALAALVCRSHLPAPVVLIAIVALGGMRAIPLRPSYGESSEPWSRATAYVLAQAQPGDCIAFFPFDNRSSFAYYVGTSAADAARAPRPVWPTAPFTETPSYVEVYSVPSANELQAIRTSCPRLWFVTAHDGQRIGSAASEHHYLEWADLEGRFRRAYTTSASRDFGWASLIRVELLTTAPPTTAQP